MGSAETVTRGRRGSSSAHSPYHLHLLLLLLLVCLLASCAAHAAAAAAPSPRTVQDCMTLVGKRSRTLGGPDQPLIHGLPDGRGFNRTIVATRDGVVRSPRAHVDLACHLFPTAQAGSSLSSPPPPSPSARDRSGEAAHMDGDTADSTGPFLPFPRRYRALAKEPHPDARLPARPIALDVLLGLPEAALASPLREHRHLSFRAHMAATEPAATVDGVAREGGRAGWRLSSVLSDTQAGLVASATHLLHKLTRFPLYRPSAVVRLFTVRSLRVDFPIAQRRTMTTLPSDNDDEEEGGGGGERGEEVRGREGSASSVRERYGVVSDGRFLSRAEALSEGSLRRLRIIAYPPTVRPMAAAGDRLVCDFHSVLVAAAHVREVARTLARRREEMEEDAQSARGGRDRSDRAGVSAGYADSDSLTDREEDLPGAARPRASEGDPKAWDIDDDNDDDDDQDDDTVGDARLPTRGGRRHRRGRAGERRAGRSRGRTFSYFSLYRWAYERILLRLFPRLSPSRRSGGAGRGSGTSIQAPLSYTYAKAYIDLVSEELGPLQPPSLSFTSDYVRFLLGRRPLFTSQTLVHVEVQREDLIASVHDGTGAAAAAAGSRVRRVRVVTERELFVWQAHLPASESMCVALMALPPPAGRGGAGVDPPLLLHLHEELAFDTFWLKSFIAVAVVHMFLRKPLEQSRFFTFIFAAICGLFTLLCIAIFYALRKIQNMSVGRMSVYLLLVVGGTTALLEGLASVGSLVFYQLLDLLDAQASGMGVLALLSSSVTSSVASAATSGAPRAGRDSAAVLDDSDADDMDERLLHESRRSAALLITTVAVLVLLIGTVSSLVVRCFVSEQYLRTGARVSLRALLILAWVFVLAVNREATCMTILAYMLLVRPRQTLWRLGGLARAGAAAGWGLWARVERGSSTSAHHSDYHLGANGGGGGEGESDGPRDVLPPEAHRFIPHYRPLAAEYRRYASDGAAVGGEKGHGVGRGDSGQARAPVRDTRWERLEPFDREGADFTRRALEDLARTIRANPEKYASRLRDPNSVRRWAGVDSDADGSAEDDENEG